MNAMNGDWIARSHDSPVYHVAMSKKKRSTKKAVKKKMANKKATKKKATKKKVKKKVPSETSLGKYSFAEAISFAKGQQLKSWGKVLSKVRSSDRPRSKDAFAELKRFHDEVESGGAVRKIVTTDPGYAERFCIASQLLALKNGFVVSTVHGLDHAPIPSEERETSLRDLKLKAPDSYPGRLFHAIMSNLVFPDGGRGPMHLIELAAKLKVKGEMTLENLEWSEECPEELRSKIGCTPLVWLLSQYKRRVRVGPVRQKLAILLSGTDMKKKQVEDFFAPRNEKSDIIWPSMNQHDSADLVCYLLSGISRLVRGLGFNGLVVLLDSDCIYSAGYNEINVKEFRIAERATAKEANAEEERKADLQKKIAAKRQRAKTEFKRDMKTCLLGLSWSATASGNERVCVKKEQGRIARTKCGHPDFLKHAGNENSGFAYPFTTQERCHLGVLYSSTPAEWADNPDSQMIHRHQPIVLPK